MSFILEALKRADRERRFERAPDLSAVYEEKTVPHSRRWIWSCSGVVLVLNILIVVLVLSPKAPPVGFDNSSKLNSATVLPKPASESLSGAKPEMSPEIAGRASPVDTQMRESGIPEHVSSSPGSTRPLVLETRMTTPSKVQSKGRKTAWVIEAPKALVADPDMLDITGHPRDSLEPEDTFLPSQPVSPEPKDTLRISDAVGADTGSAVHVEQIPLVSELPVKTRERLQILKITVHAYYPDPAKSFVFINARRYRAGDRIGGEGLLLEKIIPDGVVINYGDGRARLQTRR